MSSLARARRRIGAAPLRRLFETLAGPVGMPGQPRVCYRGLRTVAIDGTTLHVPDQPQITHRYPKRSGDHREFGYPLLRLLVVVECGTRALLAAAFGPDNEGELGLASRVLGSLDATMLVLADAGFDAATFLNQITGTGARFLVRGDANRRPTITQRLPDGSYLARIGYRILPTLLPVRIIEATVTITLADGTERTEGWRLITNLLDRTRHPAMELVHLYHERWQAETTYASIKHTILDGRVLRSRSTGGLEQEIRAVLTTYRSSSALPPTPPTPGPVSTWTASATPSSDTLRTTGHNRWLASARGLPLPAVHDQATRFDPARPLTSDAESHPVATNRRNGRTLMPMSAHRLRRKLWSHPSGSGYDPLRGLAW